MLDSVPSQDPRVATVEEHMRLENAHDFPACIREFTKAKYDVLAMGDVYDGPDRVHDFLADNLKGFPDFEFVPVRISPSTDCVVVEGRFTGTHRGSWNGLPPTGKRVDFPMCLVFDFEDEAMVSEKLYFDVGAPLQQLGVAEDPRSTRGKLTIALSHPVVVLTAFVRSLLRR